VLEIIHGEIELSYVNEKGCQ